MTTHATLEQLLEIRDGLDSSMSAHVADCEVCLSELASVNLLSSEICAAVDQAPPPEAWAKIQAELTSAPNNTGLDPESPMQLAAGAHAAASSATNTATVVPVWKSMTGAVYALAASVAFVGIVAVWMFGQQNELRHQNQMLQASINELMINSRGLEQVLQQVADQNRQMSASHQAAAERLYWRLTNVDQQINELDPSAPGSVAQAELLWNERIDALNELNKLYYQSTAVAQTARY